MFLVDLCSKHHFFLKSEHLGEMGGPRNGLGKEASKMTQDYLFMVEKEDSINPRLYEDS